MEFIRTLEVFGTCRRCRRCRKKKSVMVKDDRYHRSVSDLCATCARKLVREGVAGRRV